MSIRLAAGESFPSTRSMILSICFSPIGGGIISRKVKKCPPITWELTVPPFLPTFSACIAISFIRVCASTNVVVPTCAAFIMFAGRERLDHHAMAQSISYPREAQTADRNIYTYARFGPSSCINDALRIDATIIHSPRIPIATGAELRTWPQSWFSISRDRSSVVTCETYVSTWALFWLIIFFLESLFVEARRLPEGGYVVLVLYVLCHSYA